MFESPYTIRIFKKQFTFKDIAKDKKLLNKDEKLRTAKKAYSLLKSNGHFQNGLKQIKVKNKDAYIFKEIENKIIERVLTQNLKRAYKIQIKSRESIISVLISLLKEDTSYCIHRFDLISFFESCNIKKFEKKVIAEKKISERSITLLKKLLKEFVHTGVDGFPRGLTSSSIFTEILMLDFDVNISRIEGVYFYARFVDDIIIISTPEVKKATLQNMFDENLPVGLKYHKSGKKRFFSSLEKTNSKSQKPLNSFDYLGYRFTPYLQSNPNDSFLDSKRRLVKIGIAHDKLEKIKKRIMNSFFSFIKKDSTPRPQKFNLLVKRIRYLTSNYYLYDPTSKKKIKSGIYYNYKELDKVGVENLRQLDQFLQSLLFSKKEPISIRLNKKLSLVERRRLAKYRFDLGFQKKIIVKFSYNDLKQIKKCW